MKSFPSDLMRFLSTVPSHKNNSTVIFGGGLAGLSAGFRLVEAGMPVAVLECDSEVGGLSRTVRHGDFRFDLGGHRFFTKNEKTNRFVKDLLEGDFVTVPRKSKIYLKNKFFDYPLKPSNALFGLGIPTTLKALTDYGKEKIRGVFSSPRHISLEDWVVSNFGRTMFKIYFKEYSEKVWGIECDRISEEWVSKRIEGLSLGVAIKNALFKFTGRELTTFVDEFIYPTMGIGQISDKLKENIEKRNAVMTNTAVSRIHHSDFVIHNVQATNCSRIYDLRGSEFISSIPITNLVNMLDPAPPADVLEAASRLRYRDVAVVTIMLDRERVTDLTWMYIPEQNMPLGRIHEPKNWSPHMAPEGQTHIVAEYFCFRGDTIWNSSDEELASLTIRQLEKLNFIDRSEVIDSCVVRAPRAYPLFEVGYTDNYSIILDYLDRFKNLHLIGRTGMFKYYNMDRAIESGLETADNILCKATPEQAGRTVPANA